LKEWLGGDGMALPSQPMKLVRSALIVFDVLSLSIMNRVVKDAFTEDQAKSYNSKPYFTYKRRGLFFS